MTLRARLIVAFLLLSVVPLGIVTFYAYSTNVQAMRDVAAREADLMASVLSQRMQLITAQLSDRIAHVIDVSAPESQVASLAPPVHAAPGPVATVSTEDMNRRVADALGSAALLLDSVNVQGGRGRGAGFRQGAPVTGTGTGTGTTTAGTAGQGAPPPAGDRSSNPPTSPPLPGGQPPATGRATPPVPSSATATNPGGNQEPGRPGGGGPGRGGILRSATPDTRVILPTDDGMTIDLIQLRSDLYQQLLPPGTTFDKLTPEQRTLLMREVTQRMTGIVEGIKLSAVELQRKAQEARQSAAARGALPGGTASPATAPASPAPPPSATAAVPLKRTATFAGNQLDVKFERNGQVVRTVNAELNLPNMLMTVFASMPREQGEVPFAVDRGGQVYAQSDDDRRRVEALGPAATPSGPLGKTILPDWVIVTTAGPEGTGLRFGIARPTGNSLSALRRAAGRNAGFGLLFIVVALAGVVPLSSRLTRNLTNLTDGVSRIARGDYTARVKVRSHDEVGALAAAFNQMAADVETHQQAAVEQERMKRELELGRQIQREMQPRGALRLGLTEIKGVSVPAREVGGDFFNYFEVAHGGIAMLVGDVSGKGVGPALLMSNIQASLRTRLSLGQDLASIADQIDRDIAQNAPETLYATLFICIFDPLSRRLRYVNCGHHPQFVLRHGGGIVRMSSTGIPVGLIAGRGYREEQVQLEAGDRLFFYTDGSVEAENEAGDFFGADRLEAAILESGDSPDDVLTHVERAVDRFRGSRELLDDVTLMAVHIG